MGNKEAKLQVEKPINEILSLSDEKRQRELWRYFLETPIKVSTLKHVGNSLIKDFITKHYRLYVIFISDVKIINNRLST